MSHFLKPHFDTEGPFGLPMKDAQAKALDEVLRSLPKDDVYSLRRCSFERGVSELQPGERADVSWITEETPDRLGDIVLASGMDDSHFQLNPIVTLNHAYDQPPVGRSLWRRKARDGALHGIKAKTQYPARPEVWSGDWPPDQAFELVKAGLLRGKSIGFLPLKLREPTADERRALRDRVVAARRVRVLLPAAAAERGGGDGVEIDAGRVGGAAGAADGAGGGVHFAGGSGVGGAAAAGA